MNKSELIEKIAEETGFTKVDAGRAVDAFVSEVTKALKKKKSVTIVGFGTFLTSKRKAREGRNPKTGEQIKIPAQTVPRFKVGRSLKDAVK